jgi:uncharacterized damage-inducible protein DinB
MRVKHTADGPYALTAFWYANYRFDRPRASCDPTLMQDDFPSYWRRVRGRTLAVANRVPGDRVDWSPGCGAMTIGDTLRHLAVTERWLFVEVARGGTPAYVSHGPELGSTLPAILELLNRHHADSTALLEGFCDEDWHRSVVTPAGAAMPAWKWLRAMIEHEAHHRGQLYLMLRLCGVPAPAIFGMTSEDVRARAIVRPAPPDAGNH